MKPPASPRHASSFYRYETASLTPTCLFYQVTDLQGAIVYMASEASDYMVGHNLVVEGGQSLW